MQVNRLHFHYSSFATPVSHIFYTNLHCALPPNFTTLPTSYSILILIISPAKQQIEFVDIAGIVKGASEGAGLGNKFLMNIRMTDAIVHVVRCFVDDDIIHVDGNVDPLRDVEVISLELILADLSQIEKRLERVRNN